MCVTGFQYSHAFLGLNKGDRETAGGQWELLWVGVVWEGLSQEVRFKLSPQWHKGISLGDTGKEYSNQGPSKHKGPEAEWMWHVERKQRGPSGRRARKSSLGWVRKGGEGQAIQWGHSEENRVLSWVWWETTKNIWKAPAQWVGEKQQWKAHEEMACRKKKEVVNSFYTYEKAPDFNFCWQSNRETGWWECRMIWPLQRMGLAGAWNMGRGHKKQRWCRIFSFSSRWALVPFTEMEGLLGKHVRGDHWQCSASKLSLDALPWRAPLCCQWPCRRRLDVHTGSTRLERCMLNLAALLLKVTVTMDSTHLPPSHHPS